ncbi:hypothetical protein ACHAWU_007143 [Discostella pseudostelligera]|uniref:4-hydroxy-4-methyl-2-oxoglutarate aldolase n=1 Tax=Discostella pseudostelligera TaxID=259834 RepID=A0ABD3LXR3_9STRA
MSYSAPLSERIRIQLEIYYENTTDCLASISKNYKRQLVAGTILLMVLFTMRSSRQNIRSVKTMGYGSSSGSESYYGGYGSSSYGSSKKGGLLSRLFGRKKSSSSYYGGSGGGGLYGTSLGGGAYGSSSGSMYGGGGGSSSLGGGGGMSSSYGSGGLGSSSSLYGGGLRGATTSMGGSSYGGGSSSSFGGSSFSGGMGGGGGTSGKSLATLVDSNPTSIVVLDPSIHFYDYGGSPSFYGQIETIQAFDSPNFINQVINLPGQNKVLLIDGGGIRSDLNAVFDYDMASIASRNGWKGVIVFGFVRNVSQLQRVSNFGVKALGTCPIKGKGDVGQKGIELSVGATLIQSGWWVYADNDGVVFSQVDISGGSFGGGVSSAFGGGGVGGTSSMMSGGFGGGMSSSTSGGGGFGSSSMGGSSFGTGGGMGGGGLSGGYGNAGGTAYGGGMGGGGFGSSTGGLSAYGSSGSSMGGTSLTGGYGSGALSGYGSGGGTSSLYSGYGNQYSYGSSSYSKKKKHKTFKLLLAAAIAAIIWIICLR